MYDIITRYESGDDEMNKKAVFFDMDGTLIDTFGEIKREEQVKKPNAIERYINYRIARLPSYSYVSMMEMIEHDPCLRLFQRKVKASFDARLRARYRKAPLKSGAAAFLHYLKDQGYVLCLCTNNARHMVDQILQDHHLQDLFTEIITCYDVSKPKPDPQMYQEAMKKTGQPADHCIVFEDMLEGVMAARGAGIDVIAVQDTYNQKDASKIEQQACYVIQNYLDASLRDMFPYIDVHS